MGPAMVGSLFSSGDIISIGHQVVKPFYQQRAEQTLVLIRNYMGKTPYRVHRPRGCYFSMAVV